MLSAAVVRWTCDPALAISANGRIVAANAAAEQLAGDAASSLTGLVCDEFARRLHGYAVCDATICPFLQAMASGDVVGVQQGDLAGHGPAAKNEGVAITAITIPPDERSDAAVGVLLLHTPVSWAGGSAARHGPYTGESMPCAVQLHLLRRPEAVTVGASQRVRRRRSVEVLALLALESPAGMSRDQVCAELWPDAPRGRGRSHLRVILHDIRRTLGPGVVEVVPNDQGQEAALRLGASVWVDVQVLRSALVAKSDDPPRMRAPAEREARLRRLREVVALYHSDLDVCGEFGTWIEPHRERLRSQLLELLTEAAELAASLGRANEVISYCRRAVEVDQFDEAFRIALIETYAHLGRYAEARAEYESFQRLLAGESLAPPPTSIERAYRRVSCQLTSA